jgi:hypothetical protein
MYAFPRNHLGKAVVFLLATICPIADAARAQDDEEVVVAFLGHLHCLEVTSGAGNDDLNVTYGVLVGYTDGSYRAWGDYLYYRRSVGSGHQQRPLTRHPLFVHGLSRTREPTARDTVVDTRRVRFVRVVVCLIEYDAPPLLAQGTAGKQNLTAKLSQFPWHRHHAGLQDRRNDSVFGQTVLAASQTSYDDVIGRYEIMLTASDLTERNNVYNAATASQLTPFRTPPQHTRRDFRLKGDGADYRGSIWLTRGARSIYSQSLAGISGTVRRPADRTAFSLHNQTPYDVRIEIALAGGRTVSDRLRANQRKQYTPTSRPDEERIVTALMPDEFVVGDPDMARFRSALRRLRPLPVCDGCEYRLQFRDTTVEWVRQR